MNKGLERKAEHYSEPKMFECYWGDGYRDDEGKGMLAYHDEDFFSIDRGYEQSDINDISELRIGEPVNLSCVTGEHWVKRIK